MKAANIDEYITAFPEETGRLLNQIRSAIQKAAPQAEETISYAIPTFKLNGRPLIYFAGYKNHVAVYPVPRGNDAFAEELATYKGGKGTAQFPLDKPPPLQLITRIVKFRMEENAVEKKEKALSL
ncbi:MAG: DUF1801 domain-containing protein [Flavisolibacter sp.]|nr:DUF1801 domain-containing protein [Flavisolibacter sp.]